MRHPASVTTGHSITHFLDHGTSSAAFVYTRQFDGTLGIGFGIEADGDLDLVVSDEDARLIAEAILAALDRT